MTTQLVAFYASTVGKKTTMAVAGFVVVGWLMLHMLGNVAIFAGREPYNAYAAFLADRPPLLWGQRVVLLGALVLHIHAALTLWARNERARPVPYHQRANLVTSHAALTMRYGGVTLFAFLVYHLLQSTVGMTAHLGYEFVPHDVYSNAVHGFMNPYVAGFYVLAMGALAMHLYQGVWSMTQSLGIEHPRYDALRRRAAWVVTLIITLGFISVPLAVQLGMLRL